MTEAIFGLLGVIVGGVLNGVVARAVERRREGAAARTAARLALSELWRGKWSLREVVEHRQWGPLSAEPYELPQWEGDARERFAAALPYDDWFDVWRAFRELEMARDRAGARRGQSLRDAELEWAQAASDHVTEAIVVLAAVSVRGPTRGRFSRLWGWVFVHVLRRRDDEEEEDEELLREFGDRGVRADAHS